MNRFIGIIFFAVALFCTACSSWHMNGYRNPNNYTGFQRSFDITKWKYQNDEGKWYELELYNDGQFRLSVNWWEHCYKFGRGRWHDRGDYIILDFNDFDPNRDQEKLEESLQGVRFIHASCMVLKKKGNKDLKILPSNAVLRSSY